MAPKTRPVTAKSLQLLLTRIGSASTGTKDVLHTRLSRDLWRRAPKWNPKQAEALPRPLRLISIDMGIKNLAYCDAEISYPSTNLNPSMDIIRWDKIDLLNATKEHSAEVSRTISVKEEGVDAHGDIDPYSLPLLSQTAYWFVKSIVLTVRPDVILIERQRWRSANSAAIQQWTVRVNTLEAMIWSVLQTLKFERGGAFDKKAMGLNRRENEYEVLGIDPKRVGQFWLGMHAQALTVSRGLSDIAHLNTMLEEEGPQSKKTPRSKAEKKAKISLLQSWLTATQPSTAPSSPPSAPTISLSLGHGASKAREALLAPRGAGSKKVTKRAKVVASIEGDDIKDAEIKKLDDVTDCFLQAAAWVAWEANKAHLADIWMRERGSSQGESPHLSDEILRTMLETVEQEL